MWCALASNAARVAIERLDWVAADRFYGFGPCSAMEVSYKHAITIFGRDRVKLIAPHEKPVNGDSRTRVSGLHK